MATIWLSMTAACLPYAMWGEIVFYPPYNAYLCFTGATVDPSALGHYLIAGRATNYYIPLIILWMAYIGIACSMISSINKVQKAS